MNLWRNCRDCHQPLTNPDSQRLGYGEKCARARGLLPPKRRRTRTTRRSIRPAPVKPAPDALPGQDQLDLFYLQPTLDSL